MSSPPDSLTDIEESALNKKRGRATSVEPTPTQEKEDELNPSQENSTIVSAPKKTKRDDEDTNNVNTIRKNMKDMSTTDKNLTESQSTTTSGSQDNDEAMGTIAEEDEGKTLAAKFGGGKDDDDWGEFAEEEEEEKPAPSKEASDKPKYTFGASSGFGTKGWAASHQTIPTPSKQPTFGGFGGSSGFGGFKATTGLAASSNNSNNNETEKKPTTSVPTFGSFAKATASPFAAVAAASGDALSSSQQVISPTASATSTDADNTKESETNDSDDNESITDTPTAFGEGAKVKVPGVKQQTEVKTGEEDEDTIYQTKAKLLVLDTASGNWKERGVGTLRINMKEEETKLQTRLVMRADSVFRVILNLLLFEGMKVFIMQDKFVRFAGFETETKEDGTSETKLVSYALKLSNSTIARELCDQIIACIPNSKA